MNEQPSATTEPAPSELPARRGDSPLFPDLRGEMAHLGRWMERALGRTFGAPLSRWLMTEDGATVCPSVDVYERDGAIEVYAEVPGYTADQIRVETTGDTLTISGERGSLRPATDGEACQEMGASGSSRFRVALSLPATIDPATVSAKLADGVLTVGLNKVAPKTAEPVRIAIGS